MTGRHRLRPRVRLPDLVLSQPFEFCISISLLIMGVQSFVEQNSLSGVIEDRVVSALTGLWIATVMTGSVAIVASFLLSPLAVRRGYPDISRNRTLERVGLTLLATAAMTFSSVVLIAGANTRALFTVGIMMGVVSACVLRMVALRRTDLADLSRLREIRLRTEYARDER